MRRFRGWMLVVLLFGVAGPAGGAEPLDEASTLWDGGRYAEAIASGERALALREAVLGGTHSEVARCLQWLGSRHLLQGNPVRAEPLLRRALAIREVALGGHHPEVAETLNTLGKLYLVQGEHRRAEPLCTRALAIREAALGKDHPLVAESLNVLALYHEYQGSFARAETLYARALAIQEAALGKNHLEVAQTLYELARVYRIQGLFARAEPLYARALAIREAGLDGNHPLIAESLYGIANIHMDRGQSARAEHLGERARAILEAALGENPPDVVASLVAVGMHYYRRGWFARAEPFLRRALALQEATLGERHLLVAKSLMNLSWLYLDQGAYGRAEPLLQRALSILEAAPGGNHPGVTRLLSSLSELYVAQGLYDRAQRLHERILAIEEAVVGEDHFYVADLRVSLGDLHVAQKRYGQAQSLYERALTSMEASRGKNHFYVARALSGLATVFQAQGAYRRAESLQARALALQEASRGKHHFFIAEPLNRLASLYSAQGLYRRAGKLHGRALAIQEATHGKNHPSVAATLNQLAVVRLAQHRLGDALPLFTRAFALSELRLRQEALGFSESRMTSFLQLLRTDEERLYALLRAHPDEARVRRLALSTALLLKGRSVEESADISRTVYQSLGEQDRDTLESLRGLRTQLAQLSLQGPGSLPGSDYQQRLEALTEQAASIEADLARRSAPLRALTELPAPSEIVDRVAASLPGDSALIEFLAYEDRPLVMGPGAPQDERPSQPRYLALVLLPDATIRFQDLGPAAPIDHAASRLRDALATRDATFQASAQALHQLAFQPLLPLLGDIRRLFLSPDGELGLVPFAALHDGHQFLVDAFDFTYVPSGRSLLPRAREGDAPDSVVVLADPDFSAALSTRAPAQGNDSVVATRSLPDERFFSTLRASLKSRAWTPTPLPGTRQEAESIKRLLPQAELLLGADATKERLLRLPAPGILHLATHGFFLDDSPPPPASRAVVHLGSLAEDAPAPLPMAPLLRSGLVLAGAGAGMNSGATPAVLRSDSGLVTALELAGLDLWGTQLVVLSACDTGRGDVEPGQGVYGLHRAFLVAGAETVVMSLWKVNDETTHVLMEAYYRHLLAGQGRSTALREAMRELRRTQAHPHYWAPFLVMGRETPLRLHLPEGGTPTAASSAAGSSRQAPSSGMNLF